jgi:hypothetical protein
LPTCAVTCAIITAQVEKNQEADFFDGEINPDESKVVNIKIFKNIKSGQNDVDKLNAIC